MAAGGERPEADHAASSLRARATRTWTARRGYGEAPTVVAVRLPVPYCDVGPDRVGHHF
jgi:hypothetical protein